MHKRYPFLLFPQKNTFSDLHVFNPSLSLPTKMESTNRNIEFLANAPHGHMLHHFHHSS
jgi:hypothetical protein